MVFSMTAFARAGSECPQGRFTWEIRSVNSRYLELHFRLPDAFRDLEPALRERLKKSLSRGKVECALRFQPLQGENRLSVNHELVHELNRAADEVHAIIGPGNAMNVLEVLAWPGVISSAETDGKALQQAALQAFDDCLRSSCDARAREGEELAALIRQRLEKMQKIVAAVTAAMPQALAAQRQQLDDKIADLKITLDSSRLDRNGAIGPESRHRRRTRPPEHPYSGSRPYSQPGRTHRPPPRFYDAGAESRGEYAIL